jgi:Protein of unknown function (DUF402)
VSRRWTEGESIAGLQLFRGRPWHVWAARVVRDDRDLVALWLPRGAEWLRPVGSLFGDWTHERAQVEAPELRLTRPGAAHSILLFFDEAESFRGWYVNLEEPFRRTGRGYEYVDQLLDIWIEPDGSRRWLDEDELEAAVDRGVYSAAEAAAIRAEGERVLEAWPFPTGWEDWRPDPAWRPPLLPANLEVR